MFDWNWLDRIVDILGNNGFKDYNCTPAASPKWLVDQMPDMVAIDENGQARKFGSRRHYSFSHIGYQKESQRITKAVAEYGQNNFVKAWQTDNEFGCHETTYLGACLLCESSEFGLKKYQNIEIPINLGKCFLVYGVSLF